MKVDILAIGVHPDDIEMSCGGTLLSQINAGKTVGLLDLTRGELGTRGTPELRAEEAATAARLMGAKWRLNLGMADGFFQYQPQHIKEIAAVIRAAQPEIILLNAKTDRHPDHGRAAKLTADACYYAGLQKITTQHPETHEPQDRWRPKAVYHYIQDYHLTPDFVIDISEYIEQKMELVAAYKSQFHDPNSNELETPLTGSDFFDFMRAKSKVYGRPANFAFAEGFQVNRTPGVRDLFALV